MAIFYRPASRTTPKRKGTGRVSAKARPVTYKGPQPTRATRGTAALKRAGSPPAPEAQQVLQAIGRGVTQAFNPTGAANRVVYNPPVTPRAGEIDDRRRFATGQYGERYQSPQSTAVAGRSARSKNWSTSDWIRYVMNQPPKPIDYGEALMAYGMYLPGGPGSGGQKEYYGPPPTGYAAPVPQYPQDQYTGGGGGGYGYPRGGGGGGGSGGGGSSYTPRNYFGGQYQSVQTGRQPGYQQQQPMPRWFQELVKWNI